MCFRRRFARKRIVSSTKCCDRLQENPHDAGGHVAREEAADHGAEAELGEVGAAVGGERADAADLDGDAGEVGEAAERVGGEDEAARIESAARWLSER